MPKKPSLLFVLAFVMVAVLTILGDTLDILWLHYVCKPLIMVLLLGYVWQQSQDGGYSAPLRWLLIGMVFALLGDVFLMIRPVDLFAPGLGAFLLMQLGYSRAFYQSIRQHRPQKSVRFLGTMLVLFALYDAAFLGLLRPAFTVNSTLKPLWWPVVIYAVCLSLMGLLATLRSKKLPAYGWVVAGALLFILSDSLIAVNKFLSPILGSAFLVMSTYAAAQYLIVVGVAQSVRFGSQRGQVR